MWWATLALGAELTVNGVTLDSRELANRVITGAEVRVDANGRIVVVAPGFSVVDVSRPGEAPPPSVAAPVASTPVVVPRPTTQAPSPTPAPAPAVVPPPEQPVWSSPGVTTGGPARAASGVAYDQWWLLVAPDRATGHLVEVRVNGALVSTAREGEGGRLLDLAEVLRPGANDIRVSVVQSPITGTVDLFAGTGRLAGAAVAMTGPQISLSILPGGTMTRDLVLHVAR